MYVSESVYQHTASINFHGLLVRKHNTLHDQANQAHKLPTLTLYVHWHYITKRDNPYHLYYKFQIKTSLASDRTHWALTVSPRGEGPISSSSSIANDQNEDEDQNEDGKTKTKAKNKEQNNHHHRNFKLSFKLMAMINNKINRTLTRMYTVEHWA